MSTESRGLQSTAKMLEAHSCKKFFFAVASIFPLIPTILLYICISICTMSRLIYSVFLDIECTLFHASSTSFVLMLCPGFIISCLLCSSLLVTLCMREMLLELRKFYIFFSLSQPHAFIMRFTV